MNALLLMVHGSPRPESNEDVYRVAQQVERSGRFDIVQVGFLDCNEPDIPEAVRHCARTGATRITCVPYFLHLGRHVALDIPELLRASALEHPQVEFLLSPLIGSSEKISEVLLLRARLTLS